MSNIIPTVARSTKLVSLSKRKVFTPAEIEASQGVPGLSPAESSDAERVVLRDLRDLLPYNPEHLTVAQRRQLSGNAMHLGAAGAWQLYVSSNLVRRTSLQEYTG